MIRAHIVRAGQHLAEGGRGYESEERGFGLALTPSAAVATALRYGAMLLAILILLGFATPSTLFSAANLHNIAYQVAPTGLLAVGLALVMSTGGIDLSLGSILSLCVCVTGWMISHGQSTGSATIVGLLLGVGCGATNGVLVGVLAMPPVTVTLGSLTLLGGIALAITSEPIAVSFFTTLFSDSFSVVLAVGVVLLAVVLWLVLLRTAFGGMTFNGDWDTGVARTSEPLVQPGLVLVYAIAGLLAAFAAMIVLGRAQVAEPLAGTFTWTTALAATVLGGAGLFRGGSRSILGAVLGTILVSFLLNEMLLANVAVFWKQITVGAIILCSLLFDRIPQFLGGGQW